MRNMLRIALLCMLASVSAVAAARSDADRDDYRLRELRLREAWRRGDVSNDEAARWKPRRGPQNEAWQRRDEDDVDETPDRQRWRERRRHEQD